MSENTETAEGSALNIMLGDALQIGRAFVEAHQNDNNSIAPSVAEETEAPENNDAMNIPSVWNLDETDDGATDDAIDNHTDDDEDDDDEDDDDDDDVDEVTRYEEPIQARPPAPHPRNYCGTRYPIGMYDPFNDTFPRNGEDQDWAEAAIDFLCTMIPINFDSVINSICDPELYPDWEWDRTWTWFYALPLDVQVEVYLQRNYE